MLSIESIVLGIPALLLAISFHEFAHGYAAYKLGDPTPKYQGRLTLNPLAHLDPIGALMLLLFRFGWARPVMINSNYFKDRRKGTLIVALAGPLANVLLAWVFFNLARLLPGYMPSLSLARSVSIFLLINVQYNLGLAAFNLLPFPPLDGSKVVATLLPPRWAYSFSQWARYGQIILVVLLVTGGAQIVLNPIYRTLYLLVAKLSL